MPPNRKFDFVLGGNLQQAQYWKDKHWDLKPAIAMMGYEDLIGREVGTLYLCGTYYNRPQFRRILDEAKARHATVMVIQEDGTITPY